MKNNSAHKAIGQPCSGSQRLVEQLTTKQAIILSQKPNKKVLLKVCDHPATWIMVDKRADMEKERERFKGRYTLSVLLFAIITSCTSPYPLSTRDRNGTEIHVGDSVRDQYGSGLIIPWPEDSTMAVQFSPDVIMEVDGGEIGGDKKR